MSEEFIYNLDRLQERALMPLVCVNCGGKGYVYRLGYDGMKRPISCRGCRGTGKQEISGRG